MWFICFCLKFIFMIMKQRLNYEFWDTTLHLKSKLDNIFHYKAHGSVSYKPEGKFSLENIILSGLSKRLKKRRRKLTFLLTWFGSDLQLIINQILMSLCRVHSMIEKLAQFTDIRCCLVVGGLSTKVWSWISLMVWFMNTWYKVSLHPQCFQ